MTWRWLGEAAVLAAHDQQIAEHGGRAGITDLALLQSALARPQHKATYGKPDAADLAAAYAHGIARNHPFVDGNKRVALLAAETFLIDNGHELTAEDAAIYEAVMKLTAGETSEDAFAAWLRDNIAPLSSGGEPHDAAGGDIER